MSLTADQKKYYRTIAHHLKPIVTIAEGGISEGVINELERALSEHELIKVKFAIPDREVRAALIQETLKLSRAELIQQIGKIAIMLRRNPQPNPKLSNILRFESGRL
ncbi:YhbY family RNA-binding protein [Hahella sp. SMD15-11]|uniref:YhbY family RNA-binding protein n=1 Tax=Thermohahella caldifontis TaxID=3142973 RepID=A0AB39UWA1_9GAMM